MVMAKATLAKVLIALACCLCAMYCGPRAQGARNSTAKLDAVFEVLQAEYKAHGRLPSKYNQVKSRVMSEFSSSCKITNADEFSWTELGPSQNPIRRRLRITYQDENGGNTSAVYGLDTRR